MPKQLPLWPTGKDNRQKIWQSLDPQLQEHIQSSLAHLIHKIVVTRKTEPTKEAGNDRY
jgi:hypothetical protein